ncbi:MAG TPA: DNA mismatch repair protein MutS [Thermoanaerobaculia bacterium]|nr:DNA mismatch repair protein MutS [Thermoanaerobaculia bacterium]
MKNEEMTASELYAVRLAERKRAVDELRVRERRLSIARLVAIAAAIGVAFWSVAAALVPVVLFFVLVVMHERVITKRKRAENGAAFYERGIGRIEGTWQGRGDQGGEFADDHHPYAGDFDLFGQGSLFELISIAVTRAGRARLAQWLKEPSREIETIRARQEAVRELRENVSLREDLAIAAAEVTREIESAKLDAWASMPGVPLSKLERISANVLPVVTIVLVLVSLPSLFAKLVGLTHPEAVLRLGVFANVPSWPLLVAIVATLFLARHLHPRVEPVITAVERAEPALALLGGVLARVEREAFTSPLLVALHARLRGANEPASREIEKLRKLVALLDARRNQFFAPFAVLLLWTAHVAFAIDRWRVRSGSRIGEWIEAVGEIEALASLGSFAFEHPEFAMPEIVARGPLFDARSLGHPLIAGEKRVTNDIRLDETLRLLVVSGSNMSGKSTMMRSVGIGAVLAMAGGPVCARSLRIAPTAVGASIRIADSLQENASRFYAEILRIRQVLELSKSGPLLYLLDEVLAGTNSHDRRIGAEAIVRGLVQRGAMGLVSTHDLALAQIAESLAPRAANVHFEDHIEDGRVVFDYRMRAGVVTKSNALELMRSVGIEV